MHPQTPASPHIKIARQDILRGTVVGKVASKTGLKTCSDEKNSCNGGDQRVPPRVFIGWQQRTRTHEHHLAQGM